jgi:hypothetical protein
MPGLATKAEFDSSLVADAGQAREYLLSLLWAELLAIVFDL